MLDSSICTNNYDPMIELIRYSYPIEYRSTTYNAYYVTIFLPELSYVKRDKHVLIQLSFLLEKNAKLEDIEEMIAKIQINVDHINDEIQDVYQLKNGQSINGVVYDREVFVKGSMSIFSLDNTYDNDLAAKSQSREIMMKQLIETKVDLGGYSIYLKKSGVGTPTVLLDSGYGESSKTWDGIFNKIAKLTSVYAYDRAGLGQSDHSPYKRTSENISTELNSIVQLHSIPTPLILIGHSFGGLNCRLFATKYPELVAGMILIDTTPENYITEFLPTMSEEFQSAYHRQFILEGNYIDFKKSLDQVRLNRKQLGDLPVHIISAGKKMHYTQENQKLWGELQAELTTFSSNRKLILIYFL